jgi:hypothetical protein
MARWSAEDESGQDSAVLPVVYADNVFEQLLDAFESLAVVSSDSLQHQAFAEVLLTFAVMYERLPPAQHPRVEDLLLRILPALDDHVLTRELNSALAAVAHTLTACESIEDGIVRQGGAREASAIRWQAQCKVHASSRITRIGVKLPG